MITTTIKSPELEKLKRQLFNCQCRISSAKKQYPEWKETLKNLTEEELKAIELGYKVIKEENREERWKKRGAIKIFKDYELKYKIADQILSSITTSTKEYVDTKSLKDKVKVILKEVEKKENKDE